MRSQLTSLFVLSATVALAACAGGSSKTGDKNVVAIIVAPPNPSTASGSSIAFTATAHLLDGEAKDITKDPDTVWASSDTSVASVDEEGTATALGGGATLITASRGNLHSPPQQLTVATTPPPTPTPTPAPTANHVVISEVMYDSAGTEPATEYLELHNPTAAPVNIQGWKLNLHGQGGTSIYVINTNATIANGGFYTIADNKASCVTQYPTGVFNTGGMLALVNGGDWIQLHDSTGTLIDEMAYSAGFGGLKPPSWCATSAPSATANSVSRKPVNSDGDTCDDWVGNAAASPGAATP